MAESTFSAAEFLEKYGPQVANRLLSDMLNKVTEEEDRKIIEKTIDDLNDLLLTSDETFLRNCATQFSNQKQQSPSWSKLPPAFSKNGIEVWLFDEAFISHNSYSNHFHGYRNQNGQTVPLPAKELALYRDIINNPAKILDI
jgi:hypothetical protein